MSGVPRTTLASGKRFYPWRGENYWSVTTIISGGLPKPALIYWSANQVAEYVCEHFDTVQKLIGDDPEGAYDFLKRTPWRKRDKAAALGTAVHEASEAHVLGKPHPKWPKEIAPRMEAYERFLTEHEVEHVASEAPVFNRTQKYAGTLDWIGLIDGVMTLLDTKTGDKGPYPEAGLQLSAYRNAEFIGLPDGSEQPMPQVERCGVLKLTDEGYELFGVRADETVFRHFLHVRENYRFMNEIGKTVIGPWIEEEEERDA